MRFLIVTPSLNQVNCLKQCIASVADQASANVHLHHHVQDANSTDGTIEFLRAVAPSSISEWQYQLTFNSQKDAGLYDAVNRGWSAYAENADIVAWLNCDEQYLEGTLAKVSAWFELHSSMDGLFGDALVVQPDGELLCYRQAMRPRQRHIATSYLPVFSAAMFLRAPAVVQNDLLPDPSWRLLGDVELIFRTLEKGLRLGMLHKPLAAFTDSGTNCSLAEPVEAERQRMESMLPAIVQRGAPLWIFEHRIKRLLCGAYRSRPVSYGLYENQAGSRVIRHYEKTPTIWRSRL